MEAGNDIKTANKWTIAFAVMLGMFMSVMDITIVNVALPHMMGSFSQTLSAITWIATGYSIAAIIVASMTGWLSTLIGRKTLYLFALLFFTIGSILCATARTFPQMMVYRILQGFSSGAMIPVSQAILRESFPKKQIAMAMAVFGMGVVLAPAIGPLLGGWLVDSYGWPWIFYINVPVSVLAIWMVSRYVHDPDYLKRGVKRIDWLGILFLGVGLTSLQVVLERGQMKNWFDSPFIVVWSLISAVSLIALVFWELNTKEPIIDLSVLRNRPFAIGFIVGGLYGIALLGTTFILPQFTQTLLGYSAFQSGLTLFPRAFAVFIFMPFVGRLYNHIDAKILIFLGIGFTCWSYGLLSHISLAVAFANLVPILLLMGVGMAFLFVPLSAVSLMTIPNEKMTNATSLFTLIRRIGGNVGYAMTVTILERRTQFHRLHLVGNVSYSHEYFSNLYNMVYAYFRKMGFGPVRGKLAALSLFDRLINQQATMLSYNDLSWVFMMMFVFVIIFVFFLPNSKHAMS